MGTSLGRKTMGKLVDLNEEEAAANEPTITIIVFLAMPVVFSAIGPFAKSLWSLAADMLCLRDAATTEAVEGRISEEGGGGGEELQCAVCLCELSGGEDFRRLPGCSHGFHVDCIDSWLRTHSTCPLCRSWVAPPTRHQQLRVYNERLIACLLSALEHLCKWTESQLNSDLVSALCESCIYLS